MEVESNVEYGSRGVLPACKGPATRCDATHPRWNVLKPMRCIKIACDALQWVFQRVGISAPDFEISLLFIVRFPNGLDHCNGHLIGFI